ncbi:MAG: quinone-dependent dihydroorotate dehydrogenase [Nevskiales bacterium]
MLYSAARKILFRLDAENSHLLTIAALSRLPRMAGAVLGRKLSAPRTVMGLEFPNPIGLAAGLDKDGECISAWDALGFGFIEVGTVTPRAQPGNPRPRLFRLAEHEALINRMGFNNAGVDAMLLRLRAARKTNLRARLGVNIGKNFDTPLERATEDYLHCLRKVYALADYVTINISSPNTLGLRELQKERVLGALLASLKQAQAELAQRHGRYVPLAVKIAPDLSPAELDSIARELMQHKVDAVIATNTTVSREGVAEHRLAGEMGGLSGAPLQARSNHVIAELARRLDGALPIIGVGGILSGEDAREKIGAGASLVQIYTGFIYRGPGLVSECVRAVG